MCLSQSIQRFIKSREVWPALSNIRIRRSAQRLVDSALTIVSVFGVAGGKLRYDAIAMVSI